MPSDPVSTTIDLDASIEDVLEALRDPELLSAWLGPWSEHQHDGSATVRTDDGRARLVTERRWSVDGVQWRWQESPAAAEIDRPLDGATRPGQDVSEVTIRLTEVDGRTRLTVHEAQLHVGARAATGSGFRHGSHGSHGSIVLDSAAWLAGLLALGAVLAASSLVRV